MKDRIKQIIQTYGLNAGAFAHKIGVPASTVSYILNGRNQPSAEFFRKVLDIFPAIDANWLIMGSGAMLKNSSIAKTDKIVSEANLPINETNQIIRDTNLLINDTNSISSDVNSTQADNDFANKDIEKVKTHEKSINQGETNLFSNYFLSLMIQRIKSKILLRKKKKRWKQNPQMLIQTTILRSNILVIPIQIISKAK